jgi:hypothetical protein
MRKPYQGIHRGLRARSWLAALQAVFIVLLLLTLQGGQVALAAGGSYAPKPKPLDVAVGLNLTKSAGPTTYDTVGQMITYDYVIENTSSITFDGPFSVNDDKVTVSCTQPPEGALAPNETMTCSAMYTIVQADLDVGFVTNTARATNGSVYSNDATATVTAIQNKTLTLTKSAGPTTYDTVGQTITYDYTIENSGNVILYGPFSVADDKVTVSCPPPGGNFLLPNETMTCSATYTIAQADLDAGSVTNMAWATNDSVISNEATATVTAVKNAVLKLTKSADPTTYDVVGQMIAYSYVIENSGNVTLSGPFSVADDKVTVTCPQLGGNVFLPNETITCNATYTIVPADLDAGFVTNTAIASNGSLFSNEATATVTLVGTPTSVTLQALQGYAYSNLWDSSVHRAWAWFVTELRHLPN